MAKTRDNRWVVVVVGVIGLVVGASLAGGVVSAQEPPSSYYGTAEMEDGTAIPAGTTIIAVVDGDVEDRIEVDPSGQYGGYGANEKLRVSDTSAPVHFYIEKDDGTRIEANEVDESPTSGTEEFNLTFPDGTVSSDPYFSVTNLSPADASVSKGATVDVTADISNSVDSGTQTISFRVNGNEVDSEVLYLDTGEEQQVGFTIDTATLDEGDHTYSVHTENESQSTTLAVTEKRADFTVSKLDPTETTVIEGALVNISTTITNDGTAEGTQTVPLVVGSETVDSRDVTLKPGNTSSFTFAPIDTGQFAPSSYTLSVETENDSQSGSLTIETQSPANFSVSNLDPTETTVANGTTVAVSATITNVGDTTGSQQVQFTVGGVTANRSVTLDSGNATGVTFAFNAGALGPGSHTHVIATQNDSQSGVTTVEQDATANFTVSNLDPVDTTVTTGETVDATATITNDGDVTGTQQVQLGVDGDVVDSQSVTLAGGEGTTVALSVDTGSLSPDTYTHSIATGNDSESGSLTVTGDDNDDPATFTVSNLDPAETTATAGETVDVSAVVTNNGGETGTQQIQFRVDGATVDSRDLTLAADGAQVVTFDGIDTAQFAPGAYTHAIATEDDSESGSLTIQGDTTTTTTTTTSTTTTTTTTDTSPDGTQSTSTTANTTTENGSGGQGGATETTDESDDGGGGLVPMGLLQTLLYYVGIPLLAIYGLLKAVAIYMGY